MFSLNYEFMHWGTPRVWKVLFYYDHNKLLDNCNYVFKMSTFSDLNIVFYYLYLYISKFSIISSFTALNSLCQLKI